MKREGLAAIGNFIIDRVKIIDVWPDQDSLANILSVSQANGGAAYNLLVDLARLGASFPLSAIGLIGSDDDGDTIVNHLNSLGVDCRQLGRTAKALTSFTDVMTVAATGRRTFFHQRGTNALLRPEHIDWESTRSQRLHSGYLLLLDGLDMIENGTNGASEVLAEAKRRGMSTSVDVVSEYSDRFRSVILPCLPYVDVCFMNDFELGRFCHRDICQDLSLSSLFSAAQCLLDQGCGMAVIHMPDGAFALGRDGTALFQPSVQIPAELIRGTVGAGDAFAAGYLMARMDTLDVATCLKHGVCAASACLQDERASDGILPMAECLALGERFRYREAIS